MGSLAKQRQSSSLVIKGSWVRILSGAKLFVSSVLLSWGVVNQVLQVAASLLMM